jgi:hypothetical protein
MKQSGSTFSRVPEVRLEPGFLEAFGQNQQCLTLNCCISYSYTRNRLRCRITAFVQRWGKRLSPAVSSRLVSFKPGSLPIVNGTPNPEKALPKGNSRVTPGPTVVR